MNKMNLQRFCAATHLCTAVTMASAGFGLSACADMDPDLRGPDPIITSDMSAGDVRLAARPAQRPGEAPSQATIGSLVENFQQTADNALNATYVEPAAPPAKTDSNGTALTADEIKEATAAWNAYKPYRAKLTRFGKAGVAVANARCELYFKAVGLRARGLTFAADEISLLTTALAAVLKDIDPDTLAMGNVIGGAAATTARNFRDAYFYSPDVGNVQKLVDDAASKAAAQLDDKNVTLTYEGVIAFLTTYQSTCQPQMIRNLVNAAVAKSQPQVTPGTAQTPATGGAAQTTSTPGVRALRARGQDQQSQQQAAQAPREIGSYSISY